MIDIHAHILPGLDDGPETEENALAIAYQAYTDGVRTIIATPHIIEGVYYTDPSQITQSVNRLNKQLTDANIGIHVLTGAELSIISPTVLTSHEYKCYTLASTNRYLLLEFPGTELPLNIHEIIFKIQLNGFIPILAHPERNLIILENPMLLYELVIRGVCVQLNAGSIIGSEGTRVQRLAEELLKCNLSHFIASDVHSVWLQRHLLAEAVSKTNKLIGEDRTTLLVNYNPTRVIRGKDILKLDPFIPKITRNVSMSGV